MNKKEVEQVTNEERVAKDIKRLLKKLDTWATILQSLTAILTLAAILTSLVIGFFVDSISNQSIKIMALITAFCSVSMSVLKLEKKSSDMRDGYRYLQSAIYKYTIGIYDIQQLIDAYTETEKIVGHLEVEETAFPRLQKIKQNPPQD